MGNSGYGGYGGSLYGSRGRRPRGRFNLDQLILSRHMVPTQVSDLPFSASVALAGREYFVPTDGVSAPALAPNTESPGAASAFAEEESLEDILQQRMAWRRELLIDKGIAEFAESNYQSAFSQFVLASSLEGAADKNPSRLVVVCSIAAGNYSQGALELTKLLDRDPTLFSNPYYGVDQLYEDGGLFKAHLLRLRADRERDDGDGMPWLLLIYALWLDGNPQEALELGGKLLDHSSDPVFVGLAERLVAGVSGQPMDGTQQAQSIWPVGE